MRRRALLAAAGGGVLGGLAGCTGEAGHPGGSGNGSVEKVTYLTGFGILGQDAFIYAAVERGYFAEAGLRVEIQPGTGTGGNLRLLSTGQVQFAVIDMTGGIIEYGSGRLTDFTVFAGVYQRSVSCIIGLPERRITAPGDLEGKRIGYQPGGVNYTLFPTYARLARFDPAKVGWVSVAPQALRGLLAAGQVDAITETVVGRPAVEKTVGRPLTMLAYSDVMTDLYGNVLATSRTTAMGNPGIVRRFRDAALKGLAWAVEHPVEAAAMLHRHQPEYPEEAAVAEMRAAAPYVRAREIGMVEEARVMRSIALLHGAGAIPRTLHPRDLVSTELTPGSPATASTSTAR